ncbi:hypothetical protein [Rhizobium sp. SL42]|uniref:hypothetical protein n=1 Tax=Rhizobium sp. SL42 TaxID=2806346 RepID=UPI001F391082|nr:hypothetical protein [Rhizobium sp. SL42]UJW73778.1 hypothetical protein IM739_12840 [Rhizobium sp. SL42]
MASSFSQTRVALALGGAMVLGGCSASDRLPPSEISGVADDVRGELVLEGPVGDRRLARRSGATEPPIAYAAPMANTNGGSAAIDYLNTPNLAGAGSQSGEPQAMAAIDASGQDGSMAMASVAPDQTGAEALVIPEGGVNIDAELGISAADSDGSSPQQVQGVQPQIVTSHGAMAIAEGNTSQPVVDGIGFDNPTSLNSGQLPPVVADAEMPAAEISGAEIAGETGQGADDGILPLAEDSGTSGMDSAPTVDCSLYLDKRNCPKG